MASRARTSGIQAPCQKRGGDIGAGPSLPRRKPPCLMAHHRPVTTGRETLRVIDVLNQGFPPGELRWREPDVWATFVIVREPRLAQIQPGMRCPYRRQKSRATVIARPSKAAQIMSSKISALPTDVPVSVFHFITAGYALLRLSVGNP